MKYKVPQIIRPVLFALTAAFGLLSVSADAQVGPLDPQILQLAQANDCLSRRAAQEAAMGSRILPLQQIYAQNGLRREDVVDSKVCRRNGELYYVLSVYVNGSANTVWVNAITGMG